jgi:hypothetical protein
LLISAVALFVIWKRNVLVTKPGKNRLLFVYRSVEERLPGKCKALSSVPSTKKEKEKIEKKAKQKKE